MTWRDLEIAIVDHVGQMIEARAVGPLNDVVLLAGPLELHPAANQIVENQRSFGGHLQPHDGLPPSGLESGPIGGRFGHETAAVAERPLLALRRLALGLEFLGRGVVVIGMAAGQQLFDGLLIAIQPLRLVVGGERTAHLGPFVPIDAQPMQAVEDRLQRLLDVPLLVGVVDPQNELAAMLPGEQPIEQRGPDAANVQISGRTGSEIGCGRSWRIGRWVDSGQKHKPHRDKRLVDEQEGSGPMPIADIPLVVRLT